MENKFIFNRCLMDGRKDSVNVKVLLDDLESVFKIHGITSMKNGFIGFNEGEFRVVNCDIKSVNYNKEN
ncbi:hypothetical protein COM97_18695 [Bacillus thuringiensis]|uniref:hypothetical protein n=1 Tax=Bacillus thuringiensis TaxID=1428 RepID=UPI000BED78FF|nr:hypothetical protein [Bacillus thuringiensis]PEF04997.1 hypothetical protein COM97_18695 [Bacillus thuringiensis]